jgi:hypothetical protein
MMSTSSTSIGVNSGGRLSSSARRNPALRFSATAPLGAIRTRSAVVGSRYVHEVADEVAPGEARVVYIDNEPVAHAHAQILLEDTADPARHYALHGDFFDGPKLWRMARISRSTVHRAIVIPSRSRCAHIFNDPYSDSRARRPCSSGM